ncbi:MAG: hypothetical protein RLY31_3118 [Bacteroidota bacterium]
MITIRFTFRSVVILSTAAVLLSAGCQLGQADSSDSQALTTQARLGEFRLYVMATGELQAKNAEKIKGPSGMRSAQIWQVNITDMVAEGTLVRAGDYVARLDRTELETKLKEAQTEIDKIETQLEQAKIDTAIELRSIRDELVNLRFSLEEKALQVEQSQYEPQMVIQQAKIDMQKSERDFQQLKKKYELTQAKSEAVVGEILASLRQQELRRQRLLDLSDQFVVKAPKDGMVIYARSWEGKIGPGSQISTWDPTVAELPDLDIMVSKTYVNEVDISRVSKGQDVVVKVDAFPGKEYEGTVIQVANVGEQLQGYDAKVFEVVVQVNEMDSILRPAMTTSNEILTYTFQDVVSIPLEALHSDSVAFVYKKKEGRTVRQEVITGEVNENEVIIAHGVEAGETVYLTPPPKAVNLPFHYVDPAVRESIRRRLSAEKEQRVQAAREKMKAVREDYQPPREQDQGVFIIFD